MKVAVFSTQSYDKEFLSQSESGHDLMFYQASLNEKTANLALGFQAVCVFVNDRLDAATLEVLSAGGTQLVALRCAGFNNVDVAAAKKLGIKIVRVPAYSPQAVAEHAVALILTLNRKTHKAFNRIREQNFSLERLTGFDLFRKKVGVLGTGNIGVAFAKIMLGFGCVVAASDPYPKDELKQLGVRYVAIEELLSESDIISLHCPLTPQTHHLINSSSFDKMKPGVMLINTSRGGLVNTKDAITALKRQKLGYLGIDVYEQEEHLFFKDLSESIIPDDLISRLMTFPNVLITAHQGFLTQEALEQIAATTLESLTDFEAGRPLNNEVS